MSAKNVDYAQVTQADYLAIYANNTKVRYELIDGYAYAMTGASRKHNMVAGNFYFGLRKHLKGHACTPFMGDLKVKAGHNFYYPDVLVDCGKGDDDYFADDPVLIVEVLSPSTRKFDVTKKILEYRQIDSLQEYVLVEQDFMCVSVCRRCDDWKLSRYLKGDSITFDSIDMTLSVDELYEGVELDEDE